MGAEQEITALIQQWKSGDQFSESLLFTATYS